MVAKNTMITVLITDANKDIGLEFVHQYAQDGCVVIALFNPSADSRMLEVLASEYNSIQLFPIDTANQNDVVLLAQSLEKCPIDIFINTISTNRGNNETFFNVTANTMMNAIKINAIEPLFIVKNFLEQIANSTYKKIVILSSLHGSIEKTLQHSKHPINTYAYDTSKTALHMLMANLAVDVYEREIKVLIFSPELIESEIQSNDLNTRILNMRTIIKNSSQSLTDIFYTYNGHRIPW